MVEILKKMFETNPKKTIIVLNGKCSNCGCETIIEITSTSGGFGLQGGALFKNMLGGFSAKCADCYGVIPSTFN